MLSSPNDESPANIEAAVSVHQAMMRSSINHSFLFFHRNNIVMIILNSRKKFPD